MARVRVYMAMSVDGFIAGPDDDLGWLHEASPPAEGEPTEALDFGAFMAQVGCMLMGRRTYDVVAGFGGEWPYGDTPVLVPSHRELEPAAPTVRRIEGDTASLVAQAREVAGERDVYLDGGQLVAQALDAGLVDELCITLIPILLGDGVRLFDGLAGRTRLQFVSAHPYGEMQQIAFRPL